MDQVDIQHAEVDDIRIGGSLRRFIHRVRSTPQLLQLLHAGWYLRPLTSRGLKRKKKRALTVRDLELSMLNDVNQ